jgi:DNA replication and repair protein RecF
VESLREHVSVIARRLLGAEVTLSYRTGWLKELSFVAALGRSAEHDRQSGVTTVGPHRAELGVRVGGVAAKDHISRGQQKLLAAAMLLAQLQLFPRDAEVQPTLLLDDPAAELDANKLATLIDEVSAHSLQLVVTTLQSEFSAFGAPGRRYSIEAGTLSIVQ